MQEVLLHTDPDLLEEFIDDVLVYSQDTNQDVRRAIVGFIEETWYTLYAFIVCHLVRTIHLHSYSCAFSKRHISFMPRCIATLAGLLRDGSPQVCKRVIQSCAAVYKHTIQWLVTLADISDSTELAWTTLSIMKAEILDRIDDDNEGVRTNAIKFLEGVVILQTYPDEDSAKRDNDFSLEHIPISMKIIKRRMLEDEANKIFDVLLQFHAATHISSVNLIACTGTLCIIARMRPSFMASVVEALKQMLGNLPPTLSDSNVSSVRKHLKMQLLHMLKNHASYEMHSTIMPMLTDLGASNGEIARAMPKMDKHEQHRRAKRALENATAAALAAKRQRLEADKRNTAAAQAISKRQMEIDYDELEEQVRRATKLNEQFVAEQLQSHDACVELVLACMPRLADTVPAHFLRSYVPSGGEAPVAQTIVRIAQQLAPLLTENRLGPGMAAITKEPPMRVKVSAEEEKNIIQGMRSKEATAAAATAAAQVVSQMADRAATDAAAMDVDAEADESEGAGPADAVARKDEATKRLRENMERAKGTAVDGEAPLGSSSATAPKQLKQRAPKSLKLSDVTKPLSRNVKEKFLLEAVQRVLAAERKTTAGGAIVKRHKIITVMAATFTGPVRDTIIQFIREDVRSRLDLAFSWLYEEYSLLQGFTRHSYIKSEQKPDYSYNRLLGELVAHIVHSSDGTLDRAGLLRDVYMQAPIISDEAFRQLVQLCEHADLAAPSMQLVRDICVNRPPKKLQFLDVLLRFAMHDDARLRELAIKNVIDVYAEHKVQVNQIEAHALLWLGFLEQNTPPGNIFTEAYGRAEPVHVWNEPLARCCVALFLTLMPYRQSLVQNLAEIYVATAPDMKRTILRTLEAPVKQMGAGSEELLQLIVECPKGAETMLTRIIYILTEGRSEPDAELVRCVRNVYMNRVGDVRLIAPIINGLSRSDVIEALPRLLKLSEPVLKEAFSRLLGTGKHAHQTHRPLGAGELLVALHHVDTGKVELKCVVKATSMCLAERETFTQDILAGVLQQLCDAPQLPVLLMRTALLSLTMHPRLGGFVVQLLQRLVGRQVWRIKVLWDGFLKCAQRLRPQSLVVLLSLPPAQLADALNACPELRVPLIELAEQIGQMQGGSVSKVTLDVLHGRTQDVFITDVSGMPEYGVVVPLQMTIKSEPMEATESMKAPQMLYGGQQPLPPGEE